MKCPYHALSEFLRGASLCHREGRNSGFIDLLGDAPNADYRDEASSEKKVLNKHVHIPYY